MPQLGEVQRQDSSGKGWVTGVLPKTLPLSSPSLSVCRMGPGSELALE